MIWGLHTANVSYSLLLTDTLSAYQHLCDWTLRQDNDRLSSCCHFSFWAQSNASYWASANNRPPHPSSPDHQTTRVYLSWIEKEHLMSVTLICQLAGPFQCWHTATWKTEQSLWWIKRDRWVRLEQRSNTIMFLRYEYKTTQLTGHTRFYFISQCTRPPYFVFFVLFSSDYLHLILTAVRHLEHFRFKMQVSILDLSLKCKTPAITNMAWVSTYPHRQRHTHRIHTHTHIQ